MSLFALSIRQPWAWLIVNGYKDVENRDWYTHMRGRVLIHAGKTMTLPDYDACVIFCSGLEGVEIPNFPTYEALLPQRGGIVGEAEILECYAVRGLICKSVWFTGENGIKLCNQKPIPFIPCKGALGFFKPAVSNDDYWRLLNPDTVWTIPGVPQEQTEETEKRPSVTSVPSCAKSGNLK